jgi:hypothetical protein
MADNFQIRIPSIILLTLGKKSPEWTLSSNVSFGEIASPGENLI